jgi:glycosyltransferase involved in cell wall biosynthesis
VSDIRISFVVATYNGAAHVEAQLASILQFLGPNDEIVVSDDGSSDDTVARVTAMADPRIHMIVGDRRLGYQGNFARAIAACRGSSIFFSDQDDICLPKRIPESLDKLAHASCVCGDAVVVDANLSPVQPSYFEIRHARFGALSLFLRPSVIGATMACRRDFLLASLPFPEGVPHDMWLSVRAARRGELTVVAIPFILYRRHQTALSATGAASRRPLVSRVWERLLLLAALVSRG